MALFIKIDSLLLCGIGGFLTGTSIAHQDTLGIIVGSMGLVLGLLGLELAKKIEAE